MEQQLADIIDNLPIYDDKNITIKALRRKTHNILSSLLNPEKIIPNEQGISRDWQGLAELCGIPGEKLTLLYNQSDPTHKVLNLWHETDEANATVANLLKYLEQLDRFDVVDDITESLAEDVVFYNKNPNGFKVQPLDLEADKYILTRDDVSRLQEGLDLQIYDAFVLYSEDDIVFATELIDTMENQYNLNFCVKDRDLVGGGFEHNSIMQLISERCTRLIIILTTAFLQSSENKFFCNFAQHIGIEQRRRKIIPCLYKNVDKIPPDLSCISKINFTSTIYNPWDKLHDSIKPPDCKQTGKHLVNRSISQYNQVTKQPKSSHYDSNNSLKPLLSTGKSNSMVNLKSPETDNILLDQGISASTSANSLGLNDPDYMKKNKSKSWLKKFLSKNKEEKTNNNTTSGIEVRKDKDKKKFWSRNNVKRKVAFAN